MVRGSASKVAATGLPPSIAGVDYHLAAPMFMGLLAVVVARIVFTDRENRSRGCHQSFREFAPLTAVAMLLEVAVVIARDLPVPSAIFYGLGIGFATILILDTLGDRITAAMAALFGAKQPTPPPTHSLPHTPPDMLDACDEIDRAERDGPPEDTA